jgi:hypothetical protein
MVFPVFRDRVVRQFTILRSIRCATRAFGRPAIARPLAVGLAWVIAGTAAGGVTQESCENFDRARQATYPQYARFVLDDVEAIRKGNADASFGAALENLGRTFARSASAGDLVAVRKLIGLGLFTATAAQASPPEITFRLVCELARRQLEPPHALDPLTCAVIAVDGARQSDERNRSLAKQMIDLAHAEVVVDRNGLVARKMFDEVAPIVLRCADQL